jgi:hypothetical protein
MRLIAPALGIFLLLGASPALAFFDSLEELKEDLSTLEMLKKQQSVSSVTQGQPQIVAAPANFKDIEPNAWFTPFVVALAKWNIISGYSKDGKPLNMFGPTDPVRVGELLKIAFKSAKTDTQYCGSPRNPAALTHWSREYFACAEKYGVKLASSFPRPDDPAMRADVVTVILDVFSVQNLPIPSSFSDMVGHPDEYRIAQAATMGIVSGYGDGRFGPYDLVQRAQAAKIVYKTIEWKVRSSK